MTISDNELADLARSLERDWVERKAALTDKNKIGEADPREHFNVGRTGCRSSTGPA